MVKTKIKLFRNPLSFAIILTFIGIYFLSLSSLSEAQSISGDQFFFTKRQLLWFLLGLASYCLFNKINLNLLLKITPWIYFFSLLALFLVLIPRFSHLIFGARRRFSFGLFNLQPAEFHKLVTILFLAPLFSRPASRHIKNLSLFLILPFILIILQPNLSTAVLIAALSLTLFYLAGGDIIQLSLFCLVALLIGFLLILTSPYRLKRFQSLLGFKSPSAYSYHNNQIILSLSLGGWLGRGFANSDQKYKFLPKISTDSTLAVIGEETGFIGVILLLALYLSLIRLLLYQSQSLSSPDFSLIVSGFCLWIAYQLLINVSALVALIPLTGMPLPFVSYGGSSLISLYSALGITANIIRHDH